MQDQGSCLYVEPYMTRSRILLSDVQRTEQFVTETWSCSLAARIPVPFACSWFDSAPIPPYVCGVRSMPAKDFFVRDTQFSGTRRAACTRQGGIFDRTSGYRQSPSTLLQSDRPLFADGYARRPQLCRQPTLCRVGNCHQIARMVRPNGCLTFPLTFIST